MAAVEQLSQADQQIIPDAMRLLEDNPLRSFRIEVNADSLVQMDEQAEQQGRVEFLKAVGGFLKVAGEVHQSAPEALPLIMEMLKFGVTGFKIGKTLEGTIDQAIDQLRQQASQPKPPKPDPEMAKVQSQAQLAQQKQQGDMAMAQQSGQLEMQKIQAEAAARERELRMEAAVTQHRNQLEDARAQNQAMLDAQFERFKALLDSKTRIEVAEIAASAVVSPEQKAAATP
jgi:hypothetical protein